MGQCPPLRFFILSPCLRKNVWVVARLRHGEPQWLSVLKMFIPRGRVQSWFVHLSIIRCRGALNRNIAVISLKCASWLLNNQPETDVSVYIKTEETLCLMKMSGKPSAVCEPLPAVFTWKKYHPSQSRERYLQVCVYLLEPGIRWSVSWWDQPPLYVWIHSEAGLFSSSACRDSPLRSDPRVLTIYPGQRNCLKKNSQHLSQK